MPGQTAVAAAAVVDAKAGTAPASAAVTPAATQAAFIPAATQAAAHPSITGPADHYLDVGLPPIHSQDLQPLMLDTVVSVLVPQYWQHIGPPIDLMMPVYLVMAKWLAATAKRCGGEHPAMAALHFPDLKPYMIIIGEQRSCTTLPCCRCEWT